MASIVFFAHDKREFLEQLEYYKQDIDALRELGHEVVLCTRFVQIPRRFDALFIWWWTHALAPVLLAHGRGKPAIVTGTFNFRFPPDVIGTDYFRRPYWQRALLSQAARRCDLNLFVNQIELDGCREHFQLANARFYPHCIDAAYLQGPLPQRRKALFNIAWSGKANLIRKGVPELLEAVRLLKDRGERVQLSLAGLEGDGAGWLKGRIAELGIADDVRYLGPVDRAEKIRLLREHEVYVQPSHYEGFGVAILEAMGSGACAVVCDAGAVKEVVGDCGVFVPRRSPAELAGAIAGVLRDDAARASIQARAQQRAREFTFDKKVERLERYLAEVGIRSPGARASA